MPFHLKIWSFNAEISNVLEKVRVGCSVLWFVSNRSDLRRDANGLIRTWKLRLESSTQAVFVVTSLSYSGWAAESFFPPTTLSHNPGEQQELWVCLCVLPCCVHLCSGSKSITGTTVLFFFFSKRVWRWVFRLPGSRGVGSLVGAAEFWRGVFDASHGSGTAWLQLPLNAASKSASLNVSLYETWHHFPTPSSSFSSSASAVVYFFCPSSFTPHCVLYSAVCRVLWLRLFTCTWRRNRSPLTSTGSTASEINAVNGNKEKTARLSSSLVFRV